jgi:hypothetical protein
VCSRARGEGGIGPFAGEVAGAADDAGPEDRPARGAVGGERVGVRDVTGDVGQVKVAALTGSDVDGHPVRPGVDAEDGCKGSVVNVGVAIVAAGDDPVTGRVFASSHADAAVGQRPTTPETFPRGVIELFPGLVIARDHRHLGDPVPATSGVPLLYDCVDRVGLGGMDGDGVLLGFEVVVVVPGVQGFQRGELGHVEPVFSRGSVGGTV